MVWRSLGLVVLGAAAALIVSALVSNGSSGRVGERIETASFAAVPSVQTDAEAGASLSSSANDLAVQGRIDALEASVRELSEAVAALGEEQADPAPTETAPGPEVIGLPPGFARTNLVMAAERSARAAQVASSQRERERQQLIEGGFTPDRAEWIQRRTEELAWQAMQQQYEAQRNGEPSPMINPETMLRAELGDAEYESYLTARGRPTEVNVLGVMTGSPAANAGLEIGDQIVSYGGKRVFGMGELNEMILEGNPGESVVLEVERQGQLTQIVVPRGPLGITGSGNSIITASGGLFTVRQPGF